ncbi:hypothetical protein EXIGLDRAFT_97026 [Exidia glandulosa HHB12029]|uniref:Uncharacterized protein n=1 Tax=Exidia glandulosa HHB12029 TaxID=1314781 RepID=A0A165H401_EXIGL|nr:hypothetical protein EXIGLDRAFT_97026 [Exidia glandulosa HHB12029]
MLKNYFACSSLLLEQRRSSRACVVAICTTRAFPAARGSLMNVLTVPRSFPRSACLSLVVEILAYCSRTTEPQTAYSSLSSTRPRAASFCRAHCSTRHDMSHPLLGTRILLYDSRTMHDPSLQFSTSTGCIAPISVSPLQSLRSRNTFASSPNAASFCTLQACFSCL